MAAPTSTSGNLNTITIATIQKYLKTMADNITSGPGLMRHAKRKGLIVSEELIGHQEQVPIDREDNSNGQWFDDADAFAIEPSNGLLDSYIGHYNFRTGFYISDTEELENTGPARIFGLLDLRMKTMKRAMTIALSQAMVGAQGSNTKQFPGIRDLMGGGTPSGNSTFQGLSSATYSWWKPDVLVATNLGANNSNIRVQARHQFANLKLKLGKPKVGICDQVFYEEFLKMVGGGAETAGYSNPRPQTYSSDRPTGKIDSEGATPDIAWGGVEIIFDEYVAVPSSYTSGTDCHVNWIDTDYYYYKVDPRWNFKLFKPRERSGDDNQYVSHYAMVFRCTPICLSRRAHGITVFDL